MMLVMMMVLTGKAVTSQPVVIVLTSACKERCVQLLSGKSFSIYLLRDHLSNNYQTKMWVNGCNSLNGHMSWS